MVSPTYNESTPGPNHYVGATLNVLPTRAVIAWVLTTTTTSASTTYHSREALNKPLLHVWIVPVDSIAPTVPGGLTSAVVSSSQVNLTWSASTDAVGVQGYKVYRDNSYLSTVGPVGSASFSDTGLARGSSHTYQVSAIDAAGNESARSTTVSATSLPSTDTVAPTNPSSVAASASAWNVVNVTWTASTDTFGVTRYTIFRDGTKLAVVNGVNRTDFGGDSIPWRKMESWHQTRPPARSSGGIHES